MKTELVTAPTGMIVSLDEAKKHLNIDHTDDDGYIQALIMSAISSVENITNRRLITQTWKAYSDLFPAYFTLPFGKLQSVTSLKYTDVDGDESTMTASEYIVDIISDPGRLVLADGETWPSDNLYPSNPIKIEFVCGYGDHTLQTITAASNATPIAVTIVGHGYVTGDRVLVSKVVGNTNANGAWNITKSTDDIFTLDGSTGNAAYTSGGIAVKLEVPEPIRIAIMLMVADVYQNRGSIVVGNNLSLVEIPEYIMNFLWSYRLF